MIKLTNSLRTQLSKKALAAFQILFENLGKTMDINVDFVIPSLIKSAGHTNKFIAQSAEAALIAGCQNCNEIKIASAALSLAASRTNSVK